MNVGINDNDAEAVNEVNVNVNVGMEDDGDGGSQDKVAICHDGNTLEVAPHSLSAHYGHGDTLGPCDDETSAIDITSETVTSEDVNTASPEEYSESDLIEPD